MAWTKEWTELWSEDRALADLRLLVQRIHQIVCLKLMDSQMKKTWQVSSWTFPRQGQLNQSVQPSRRGWNYPTFINFPHSLTSSRVLYKNSAPPKILVVYIIIFPYFHIFIHVPHWPYGTVGTRGKTSWWFRGLPASRDCCCTESTRGALGFLAQELAGAAFN